jgi:pimeloyl-ACP methyl ester carboxylesterase
MDAVGQGLPELPVVTRPVEPPADSTRTRSFPQVLLTTDGVRLAAEHLPATGAVGAPGTGRDLVFVVAHGFTGALERPAVRRAARVLAEHGGVVTFSFRGHGGSGGRSTVGDRETLDLDAAVGWARRLGYRAVATVGFSMGGSVVLRHAGATRAPREANGPVGPVGPVEPVEPVEPVDAVVAVSAPARWYYRGTAPMRRLHWVVTRPVGRLVSRYGLRTRVHHAGWDPVPLSPVGSVPYIPPTPLLIVHGDQDAYFPLDHPRSLAEAAAGGADLWIEPGFGHAENAADAALLTRIAAWTSTRTAQTPARAAVPPAVGPSAEAPAPAVGPPAPAVRAETADGAAELPPAAAEGPSWTARTPAPPPH